MGYFSQRKKQERENLFMVCSLWTIAVVFFITLLGSQKSGLVIFLNRWAFHFYLFNLFILGYTLWHRRMVYFLFALVFLMLNYVCVARTANLFFNRDVASVDYFNIIYKKGAQDYDKIVNLNHELIRRSGIIELSPGRKASFIVFEKNHRLFTVISLDFGNLKNQEQKTVFGNLAEFVLSRDDPVIVVGDFGIPAWADIFKRFLIKTDLKVKNKILLTDGRNAFKPLSVPTINVLAYNNIGIRRLKFDEKAKKFDIRLSF